MYHSLRAPEVEAPVSSYKFLSNTQAFQHKTFRVYLEPTPTSPMSVAVAATNSGTSLTKRTLPYGTGTNGNTPIPSFNTENGLNLDGDASPEASDNDEPDDLNTLTKRNYVKGTAYFITPSAA